MMKYNIRRRKQRTQWRMTSNIVLKVPRFDDFDNHTILLCQSVTDGDWYQTIRIKWMLELFFMSITMLCYSPWGLVVTEAGWNGILITVSLLVSDAIATRWQWRALEPWQLLSAMQSACAALSSWSINTAAAAWQLLLKWQALPAYNYSPIIRRNAKGMFMRCHLIRCIMVMQN